MTTVTGRHGQEYCQLCNPRPDNHPKLYFRSNVHSLFCRNLPRAILTCPPRNQPRQIVKQTRQPSPTHNPMHTHDDVFEAIGGFLGQVCVEPNGAISWNGIRNTAPSAPTPLPAPSSTEPCPLPPSKSDFSPNPCPRKLGGASHPPAMRWRFGECTAAEAGNCPGLRRPTRRGGVNHSDSTSHLFTTPYLISRS